MQLGSVTERRSTVMITYRCLCNVRDMHLRYRFYLSEPSPPSHVEYTLVAPGAVEVRWKEPTKKNGIIVSYIIRYSNNLADPDSKWFSKRENGTVTYSTVYDLEVDAMYFFKVGAETVAGEGPPTKILMVRTQPVALPPSRPPTGEYGNFVSPTSVSLVLENLLLYWAYINNL